MTRLLELQVPAQQLTVPQQLPELTGLQCPAVPGCFTCQQGAHAIAAEKYRVPWMPE